jgi:5-methylcytosine-specific restriction endonuclease McrA
MDDGRTGRRGRNGEGTGRRTVRPHPRSHATLDRLAVFARDDWTCVYCGTVGTADTLSVDHLQPRVKGGDRTAGNLVTACHACNRAKGHGRLADFLAADPARWRNFRARARYAWPRLLRSVETELHRRERAAADRPPRRPPPSSSGR